jgi:hypothetical protein
VWLLLHIKSLWTPYALGASPQYARMYAYVFSRTTRLLPSFGGDAGSLHEIFGNRSGSWPAQRSGRRLGANSIARLGTEGTRASNVIP